MEMLDKHIKMKISVRGIADKKSQQNERVVIDVIEDCNLWDYMILDTTYDNEGNISNLHRHSYFFKDYHVKKGDIIYLYSKKGVNKPFQQNNQQYHFLYWGFDKTIWNDDKDIAILIKIANRIAKNV